MPKKHSKPTYKPVRKEDHAKAPAAKVPASLVEPRPSGRRAIVFAAAAVLITLTLYIPSLFNDWIVNWDDGGYIHEHELIHKLSGENIAKIFHPMTFYKGNYHPLTTFFYALEYSLVGENAFLYHLNNLIFHLMNVLLVFYFIRLLTRKVELAAFVALLFGIHPMHVESVAWVSERKDVLYTFFFLLSCICYYFYLNRTTHKTRNYIIAILLFFLSLLSKSAAVALPGVLLLMDYWQKRKFSWKLMADKIPFIAFSLAFGILAVMSQGAKGAIQDLGPLYSPFDRIFLVSYNIVIYIAKLFAPFGLSAMHPYPSRVDGHLPIFFYVALGIVLLLTALIIWSKRYGRKYIFGMLFFLVTIILVLQIIPVGGALMAERYTYVPYIGIFFMLGWIYQWVWETKQQAWKKARPFIHAMVAAFLVFLLVLSWQRIALWKNGEILFTDLIRTYPHLPFGYNNRGYLHYRWLKDNDKALADFTKAISLDTTYYQAWGNRGVLYYNTGKYEEAIHDFSAALRHKPDDEGSLIGRANTYSTIKKFDIALPDYDKYLPIRPDDTKAWMWRGTALYNTGKTEEAMADFEKSHSLKNNLKPEEQQNFEAEINYWKGLVLQRRGQYSEAISLFDISAELNPSRAEVFAWRGIAHYNLKQYDSAIADLTRAVNLNPNDGASYVNRANAYHDSGRYAEAFADLNTAGKMGYPLNKEFFFKVMGLAGAK